MIKRLDRKMPAKVRVRTVGDLFDFLTRLEDRFEQYYSAIRDRSGDNNARLLSYYLGRRYRRLRSSLKDFGARKACRIRKNKLHREIAIVPQDWMNLIVLPPDKVAGKNLLDTAIRYNRKLIAVYRNMLSQALTKDTALLIGNLKRQDEQEYSNFRKMLAMNYF